MPVKDETGKTHGRLKVLERVENSKSGKVMWLCECDCGSTKPVRGDHLRSGSIKSCGCFGRERTTTHGRYGTKLYEVWQNMAARCTNPNNTRYHNYGGRGISVCREWRKPGPFLEWAEGKWEPGLQIDREDNDGDYTPDNCRFVTSYINNINQRKRKNNTSGYTGVYLSKRGKFEVALNYLRKKVFLGTYPTPWQAAKARNDYIKKNNLPHKIQEKNLDA